ncbi:hypothetical protein [Alkalihalobacterium chitinilyticum]|uniref:Uncharacterized protein n=1 Tax=Alkalihalobacterium chitinilyticum TaxID=2980103 RepID=A0ABT5V8Q9_9BACI|nr:hypothetical protein [Alkalihalobacterium chitinilyticum]MDE5411848.1 hypothetical protein [Alkalihalobacterium chitinilyticum]
MLNRLLEIPWIESILPDRLRPVQDEILSDEATLETLHEAERILEHVIKQSSKYSKNRTVKKKHHEYVITVKIKKKMISLTILDTYYSKSKYKKRIYIQCYRKYFKADHGVGKCKEASIHYTKNKKTFVRSVKKSPYTQNLFYKIDKLDDALLGQLIQSDNEEENYIPQTNQLKSNDQVKSLVMETNRLISHTRKLHIDPLIEKRLEQIIDHTEMLLPDFSLLEIEERHMMKRMLNEDIPNLVHTYLSLSPENKKEQRENVFVTLSKMELTLIRLKEDLEKARVQRMEHLLKLNHLRYTNDRHE